jgi:hypothetical protein
MTKIKRFFFGVLAALALCGAAQATAFNCMGSALAGSTAQGVGRQFGVRAGPDWENPVKYGATVGSALFWYCRVSAPPVRPVAAPGGTSVYNVPATPGVTGVLSGDAGTYIIVNSLHTTDEQFIALPDNTVAQIRAQGPAWLQLMWVKQCWEMAADHYYSSVNERTLCEGMLSKARSVAPR